MLLLQILFRYSDVFHIYINEYFICKDSDNYGKTQIKFGFSLDLNSFLTLKNANLIVFFLKIFHAVLVK